MAFNRDVPYGYGKKDFRKNFSSKKRRIKDKSEIEEQLINYFIKKEK